MGTQGQKRGGGNMKDERHEARGARNAKDRDTIVTCGTRECIVQGT